MKIQYRDVKETIVRLASVPFIENWRAYDNRVKCEIAALSRDVDGYQEKIRIITDYLEYLVNEAKFFRTLEEDTWKFYEAHERADDREVLMANWIFGNLRGEHANAIDYWQGALTRAKQSLALHQYWQRRRG